MTLPPGFRVGAYEIVAPLGAGGMGEVYRARDRRLDRDVALKVLPAASAADPEARARFEREARAAAALSHPNVVTVHSVEHLDGLSFITMELVAGHTLRSEVRPGGVTLEAFFDVAAQVLDALAAAHRRGIVHRDLKPENVMVDEAGRVRVLDFGLARLRAAGGEGAADDRTRLRTAAAGVVLGTSAYMSPEQLRGRDVDHRADLFSVGVLFFELLTGVRPFRGDTFAELAADVLRGEPPPVSSLRADLPAGLDALLARCLAREPADRVQSAEELREALRAVRGGRAAPPAGATGPAAGVRDAVAVVDFVNISGDASVDWLSSGIAETVTVDLKRRSPLPVVSRDRVLKASAAAGPGASVERHLVDVGARLGVTWVVGGAYQKFGPAIRITASFVSVTGQQIEGTVKVDGTMDQIFELQDRVLTGLLETLAVDWRELPTPASRPQTRELKAYECCARARDLVGRMDLASLREARELFERAVAIDPDYALAHAGLGQVHCMRFIASTARQDLDHALAHLHRAIELDERQGEAFCWLAYAFTRLDRFDDAIRAGQRAVELEPDYQHAHYFLGAAHYTRAVDQGRPGDWRQAMVHLRRAAELAPRWQAAVQLVGFCFACCGDYGRARPWLERAAALQEAGDYEVTQFVGAALLLARLHLARGDLAESEAWCARSLAVLGRTRHVYTPACVALTHVALGEIAHRRRRHAEALSSCEEARHAVEASPRTLSIGWALVLAELVAARSFAALRMRREEQASLSRALSLLAGREGFDFGAFYVTEAMVRQQLAAYHAEAGRYDAALDALEAAARRGLADVHLLEGEPAFAPLASWPRFAGVRAGVAAQAPVLP